MAFVYAWIVPLLAAQLLPHLLIEQFDTLWIQCRHIEHMQEGVYNFCLAQILLKSSFQNLGLLVLTITCQVFSLNLTVLGVSNKHCLLTLFICIGFSTSTQSTKYNSVFSSWPSENPFNDKLVTQIFAFHQIVYTAECVHLF